MLRYIKQRKITPQVPTPVIFLHA